MRFLAVAVVGLVLGQPGDVLNGSWAASFQGATYGRLTFAGGAPMPQGTMSIAESIHGDAAGNVDDVIVGSFMPTRMLDIGWSDGVLSFGINDGPNVDRFEFRLIDATHAELAMMLSEEERRQAAAEQLPLPKPFRLTNTP